jgi:hypothetical protein
VLCELKKTSTVYVSQMELTIDENDKNGYMVFFLSRNWVDLVARYLPLAAAYLIYSFDRAAKSFLKFEYLAARGKPVLPRAAESGFTRARHKRSIRSEVQIEIETSSPSRKIRISTGSNDEFYQSSLELIRTLIDTVTRTRQTGGSSSDNQNSVSIR